MPIFPFPNSREFADRIKSLRTKELAGRSIGTTAIAQAGGPSTTHQSRIETYTSMSITAEVINQYDQALTKLAPEAISAGFITALAAAYGAVQQDSADANTIINAALTGTAIPAANISQIELNASDITTTAKRHAPDLIYVGIDVDRRRPVFANSIRRGPHHVVSQVQQERADVAFEFGDFTPSMYLPRLANDSSDAFANVMVRLARRHPGITLASGQAVLINNGKSLPEQWEADGGAVHRNVEAAIDPIAGISTLKQARARAQILSQQLPPSSRNDELWLAWMILFANATGEECGCGALDAYIRYRNTDRWDNLRAQLPVHVTGGFPNADHMKGVAQQYLQAWARARTEPQFETSFQLNAPGGQITWRHTEVKTSYDIPINSGDLWLENEWLEVPLAEVLHAIGIYSLRIDADILAVTKPAAKIDRISYSWYPISYSWYPSGISDRIALLHRNETGWSAVQIY